MLSLVSIKKWDQPRVSTYPQLNDETIAALTEGDAIASGRLAAKRYGSVDDLFADMD